MKIVADKTINREIIEGAWEDILRLVATTKLKETTASDIYPTLPGFRNVLSKLLPILAKDFRKNYCLQYIPAPEFLL